MLAGSGSQNAQEAEITEFGPKKISIPVGGSVTWSIIGPHSLTFNSDKTNNDIRTVAPDGTVHINPKAIAPSNAPGEPPPSNSGPANGSSNGPPTFKVVATKTWDGTGFLNTGVFTELVRPAADRGLHDHVHEGREVQVPLHGARRHDRVKSTSASQPWAAAVLAAAALLSAGCGGHKATSNGSTAGLRGLVPQPLPPKPSFTLTDTAGRPFSFAAQTRGKLTYLYFGYTHCPNACPATMDEIAYALKRQPASVRKRVEVVFVTVDPRRDTRPVLRAWLDHFNKSFVGLTGSEQQIEAAESAAGIPFVPGHVTTAQQHGAAVQPGRLCAHRLHAGLRSRRLRARPAAVTSLLTPRTATRRGC